MDADLFRVDTAVKNTQDMIDDNEIKDEDSSSVSNQEDEDVLSIYGDNDDPVVYKMDMNYKDIQSMLKSALEDGDYSTVERINKVFKGLGSTTKHIHKMIPLYFWKYEDTESDQIEDEELIRVGPFQNEEEAQLNANQFQVHSSYMRCRDFMCRNEYQKLISNWVNEQPPTTEDQTKIFEISVTPQKTKRVIAFLHFFFWNSSSVQEGVDNFYTKIRHQSKKLLSQWQKKAASMCTSSSKNNLAIPLFSENVFYHQSPSTESNNEPVGMVSAVFDCDR